MYTSLRERLIHLHHCRGAGWKTIHRLLQQDPSLSSIFSLSYSTLASFMSISPEQYSLFFQDLHSIDMQSMIKTYRDNNIHIVTVFDDIYPKWLKHIFAPPWVLYAKGNIEWLSSCKMISMVGTRKPTEEGIRALRLLVPPLIQHDWTIVSGLALGIDAAAHQTAVQSGGKTIAVIAGGVEHIYPKQNRSLAEKLMNEHLVVSEYPPHTKPQKWQFPLRNRIISGLSLGTVVVQAKEKSGSLITASLALEAGREVFAVPGSIFLEQADGTNQLIQMGAKLVRSAWDIMEEFSAIFPLK
ncbi:DNA protecting protein DprA [Anoxybacillus sp. B7M1]|jgi:DNA processing protein|uniref:DNA-processing protein DprA n=1 Tax=unclassified Anoxybacillus TaxID=2639704 RepID=UPI0005CCC2A0|nr:MULTISPECIES: DNA-processing protein DprA [unclassified Anoxybacillus]ANB58418.1 DNA protecting protein DprA [Anoxybacillus sp. B2M1]ANB64747.1 DNA protecting protein DprA [Anoxybacillus sp. B7M1]